MARRRAWIIVVIGAVVVAAAIFTPIVFDVTWR